MMSRWRVFPDTGALLAMIVFPRDRHGHPTLAGEVLQLYDEGAFDLIISRVVVDELEEVIDEDFSQYRSRVVAFLAPFAERFTRWPTSFGLSLRTKPEEVAAALPHTTDPEDAPIFAAVVIAQPDIVLSNDFQAFHSPQAKAFWEENGIAVESLYGLLRIFGRREREG